MKKIAVVASGWHFPGHFYESMARQAVPEGWKVELFCVSHRDPKFAQEEKKGHHFSRNQRGKLDKLLYSRIPSKEYIEMLGWKYMERPNTIGDWGNTNQWLAEFDYKEYDLLLATHDDNLIIHDRLFADIVEDAAFADWDILTNSPGMPQGTIRGSFEFFKPKVLDCMGGSFDISSITLTREGVTSASQDRAELYDWNNFTDMMQKVVETHGLRVGMLSPCYRVSAYCIEGERGYISNTHGANTYFEEEGLKFLKKNKVI